MAIKNIVFDFGGVLLALDYFKTQQAFVDLGCKNFEQIYSQAQQTDLFNQFDRGEVTETIFFEELKNLSGLKAISIADIMHAWNAMLINLPKENYVLLKELKNKYRVFLLSNTNETHIIAFEKLIPQTCSLSEFESMFEKIYYSCRIHLRKPDVECFRHVLNDSKLNPEETIFIDDSIQHLEGAKKSGITPYWLQKGVSTTNLIKEIGLL
jgi:epoxide hydrolase-like predicted phosphatase